VVKKIKKMNKKGSRQGETGFKRDLRDGPEEEDKSLGVDYIPMFVCVAHP
jgi:hypothetical protein